MDIAKSYDLKNNVEEFFIKEKNKLEEIIYSEIRNIELSGVNNTNCGSVEMLKDAIFVIEKGFEDILYNLNEFNFKERQSKLIQFKESLIYVLYGV